MNKYENAIEEILHLAEMADDLKMKIDGFFYDNVSRETDVLNELVYRATPKKYEEKEQIVNGISIIHAVCPNCGIEIDEFEHYKGCPYCLQALDWSGEE